MAHHEHESRERDEAWIRLVEAADRMEITELLHRYAHAIDNANFDLLAEASGSPHSIHEHWSDRQRGIAARDRLGL